MPSHAANLITRQHRQRLAVLGAAVSRRIRAVSLTADPRDIDAWWQRAGPQVVRLVTAGHGAAARLAAMYLRQHSAADGVPVTPVLAVATLAQVESSMRFAGPVSFKRGLTLRGSEPLALRKMQQQLEASSSRLTLNGDRETVLETFKQSDSIKGWRRIGDDDPCFFCAMLVSRGAVYSEGTVEFRAHDSCSCSVEPLYRHEPEPEDVRQLQTQWEKYAAGHSGKDAIRAFRRGYESHFAQAGE